MMNQGDFSTTLKDLLGPEWVKIFMAGTGYSRTQVYRFQTGHPVPPMIDTLIECISILRSAGIPLPSAFDIYRDHDAQRELTELQNVLDTETNAPSQTADHSIIVVVIRSPGISDSDFIVQVASEYAAATGQII